MILAGHKNLTILQRVTACGGTGTLVINLCNGVLHDALGRTGYIASNRQFQFDEPPQAGAIYTAGFSVCSNGSLALGGSAVFQQCLSGSFYNLYDQSTGAQCSPVYIETIPCTNGTTPTCGAAPASVSSAVAASSTLSSSTIAANTTTTSTTTTSSTTPSATPSTTPLTTPLTTSTTTLTPSVASSAVVQSSDGQPQVTTTATASIAVQTKNAGSALSAGKEFAALAAGVAALVMI